MKSVDSCFHALVENGAMAGRERTDPTAMCLKRCARLSPLIKLSDLFPANLFLKFGEHEFYMLRVRRFGAMCFASGSIFGNKFLTPEGIKTLFPIFENSLCNKELAVETQHLKCTKTKWTFILCPKIFKTVPNHLERFSSEYLFMAIFWLKGEVGGNSQFVSS
jgi:hypothetical protein